MLYMSSSMRCIPDPGGPAPSRIAVVAVGGNALTAEGQQGTADQILANAAVMAGCLAGLAAEGWQLAVVHGNGPQVGALSMQQDAARHEVPAQPMHDLCAMTQGQLGSVLVRSLDALLGGGRAVAVVTHVAVDLADPGFGDPTKPIGPFFTQARAQKLAQERGWHVREDSGRGWRRVVPSPQPGHVVELGAVRTLIAAGHVVLAAGGGGVAVAEQPDGSLLGVDAVVDKDLAAAALASSLGATDLYLLTGVANVLLDFGTAEQRPVHSMTAREAEGHLADGQFPPGSMGPKVEAALRFLQAGGTRAIITSAELLAEAAAGTPGIGTEIVPVPGDVASVAS